MSLEFEQVMKQHAGRIRQIAQRYADTSEVEDLFQEISISLWRSFGQFRGDSSIETWLYRVAFNTAMTSVRKSIRSRKKTELFKASTLPEATKPDGYSQADILTHFIGTLNEIEASILMMYLDGR